MIRTLLSWSSGKDSAWALHVLRQQSDFLVVGLLTTLNQAADRVAMHGVRRQLVEAQAAAAGLPLHIVPLPWPCSNSDYESQMHKTLIDARRNGVTHVAFGDLFLEDIRAYREGLLTRSGMEPVFPLWTTPNDTPRLAQEMIDAGLRAVLTCVDPKQLDGRFVGRSFDEQLLRELPPTVDPCGERGEFHTFCCAGPMFRTPLTVRVQDTLQRDGFWFADLVG